MKKKELLKLPYFLLFFISGILLIEILLNYYYGKSLCPNKGCEFASYLIILPKKYLLLLAFCYFSLLFLFTKIYFSIYGSFFLNLLLFLLSAGLFLEGVLVGRLLWDYQIFCDFCLFVALIVFLLIISYLFILRGEVFSNYSLLAVLLGGFLGFSIAFNLTALPQKDFLNSSKQFFLIYSEDCPKCKELISQLKGERVELVPLKSGYSILRGFNFTKIPILIEKTSQSFIVYFDLEKIEEKLLGHFQGIENNCSNSTQGALCELP